MTSLKLTIDSTLPLKSSTTIPRLGFGVYLSPPEICKTSCLTALRAGYRHIDTAQYYENESEVGQAVRESGIPRDDIFLTTKILFAQGSVEKSHASLLSSVAKLSGDDGYVDLFLIHSPNAGSDARKEMWLALEKLYKEGKAKSIGVSNWGVGHIKEAKSYATIWPPHVNQIELHCFSQQREIVRYCEENDIVVEAYSPLVRNQKADDPTLKKLAAKHEKAVTQILIRYCLQKGWVPLPKSDTESRIKENADVFSFELSKEDMKSLDDLDQGAAGSIVQVADNKGL